MKQIAKKKSVNFCNFSDNKRKYAVFFIKQGKLKSGWTNYFSNQKSTYSAYII